MNLTQIRERFEDYIRRFNAKDMTAFEEYIATDMKMMNGTLEFEGVQGMKEHYDKIWKSFDEILTVKRFVADEHHIAIEMWAHFIALNDDANTLFGAVKAGETFDFQGLIFYDLEKGKFFQIKVAYNRFIFTNQHGEQTNLGIPH
ncbi:MAG: hypothetical protein RLZZ628_148 [Bacteroidota bacterium]|jgi:hypothetical protein